MRTTSRCRKEGSNVSGRKEGSNVSGRTTSRCRKEDVEKNNVVMLVVDVGELLVDLLVDVEKKVVMLMLVGELLVDVEKKVVMLVGELLVDVEKVGRWKRR